MRGIPSQNQMLEHSISESQSQRRHHLLGQSLFAAQVNYFWGHERNQSLGFT